MRKVDFAAHKVKQAFYLALLVPFYLAYCFAFFLMHPVIYLALRINKSATQLAAHLLAWVTRFFLFLFTGSYIRTRFMVRKDAFDVDLPTVIISNHQHSFDIAAIINAFHPQRVFFVSKIELGKYFPSVSLLLRSYNGILINRKDSAQALFQLRKFKEIFQEGAWVAIFPEGTRSRTGALGRFKTKGLRELLTGCSDVQIIPVVFTKNFRLGSFQYCPFFVSSEMYILKPFIIRSANALEDSDVTEFLEECFGLMRNFLAEKISVKNSS